MPVVALTEKGLLIDVFGSNPVTMESQGYKTSGNALVSVYNKTVRFVDLQNPKDFKDHAIDGFDEFVLSKNGSKCIVKGFNKKLTVFNNGEKLMDHEDVEESSLSDTLYGYITAKMCYLYEFSTGSTVFQTDLDVKNIYCLNIFTLLIVKKESSQQLIMIKDGKSHILLDLPNIYALIPEVSSDGKNCLMAVDIAYAKGNYYADSELYLLKLLNDDGGSSLGGLESDDNLKTSENKENTKTKKTDPVSIIKNEVFELFVFKTLKQIYFFRFLDERFYVCFGTQPACLHLYSGDGVFIRNYKKSVRNRVLFSADRSKIINAGFGNLPGNIEVCVDDTTTCRFQSLGSSIIEWMNDDTHFMVATTNYFKDDNKVTIYDYYGRVVEEMECSDLVDAHVYGLPEPIKILEPPKESAVPAPVSVYVPPHLQNGASTTPNMASKPINKGKVPIKKRTPQSQVSAPQKKPLQPQASAPQKRTKDIVTKELDECMKLKARLADGEDLTPEQETRVFKINSLIEELSKF